MICNKHSGTFFIRCTGVSTLLDERWGLQMLMIFTKTLQVHPQSSPSTSFLGYALSDMLFYLEISNLNYFWLEIPETNKFFSWNLEFQCCSTWKYCPPIGVYLRNLKINFFFPRNFDGQLFWPWNLIFALKLRILEILILFLGLEVLVSNFFFARAQRCI